MSEDEEEEDAIVTICLLVLVVVIMVDGMLFLLIMMLLTRCGASILVLLWVGVTRPVTKPVAGTRKRRGSKSG